MNVEKHTRKNRCKRQLTRTMISIIMSRRSKTERKNHHNDTNSVTGQNKIKGYRGYKTSVRQRRNGKANKTTVAVRSRSKKQK